MLRFQVASVAGPTADRLQRANKLYDSFFPSTQNYFMEDDVDFDPQDTKSAGFAPRIIEFVELLELQDENYAQLECLQREENRQQGIEQPYTLLYEQQ